jgi:hypothetical protein
LDKSRGATAARHATRLGTAVDPPAEVASATMTTTRTPLLPTCADERRESETQEEDEISHPFFVKIRGSSDSSRRRSRIQAILEAFLDTERP